jgi:hypothetical protein
MRGLLLVVLVGCGMQSFVSTEPRTVGARDDAFAVAMRTLTEMGESVETRDEASGLIVTKWIDLEQMSSLYQLRISITITEGRATVAGQCQYRFKDNDPMKPSGWQPCGDRQPESQSAKIARVAAAIAR